jgi:dienelactone hydrolase/DNA-directed RNA polymerase subunit RPC12/RpoP
MALAFRCSQCGKTYSKADDWAGKTINCEGCGKGIRIPALRTGIPLEPQPASGSPAPEPGIRRTAAMVSPGSPAPFRRRGSLDDESESRDRERSAKSKKTSPVMNVVAGVVSFFVVAGVVSRYVIRPMRAIQQAQSAQQKAIGSPTGPGVVPVGAPAPLPPPVRGPWRMPVLPEPGTGVLLEPGIRLLEVRLPGAATLPGAGPAPSMPGHSGKLWLYLPEGDLAPKSLPCIVIAGAGSNLITGMALGDGDRPEHLPYVRAGFAVLAYELDGMLPDPKPTTDAELARYIRSFLDAEAGLINMKVALEFATTKVPSIDPTRLYAVGHSSAATLALLVAENEPRIAACVAFAPAVDITSQYNAALQHSVARLVPGADLLFSRFNPRMGESKLTCPVFLFVALDDQRFAQQVQDLASRLDSQGNTVTLSTVSIGGHYNPMIKSGIPEAIHWLESLQQEGNRPATAKRPPGPRSRMNPRRPPAANNPPGQRRMRTNPGPNRQNPGQ